MLNQVGPLAPLKLSLGVAGQPDSKTDQAEMTSCRGKPSKHALIWLEKGRQDGLGSSCKCRVQRKLLGVHAFQGPCRGEADRITRFVVDH